MYYCQRTWWPGLHWWHNRRWIQHNGWQHLQEDIEQVHWAKWEKLAGRDFIVQSDNDPEHTAKATQEFIAKKKWKVLNWPSQSPDLNPIEHIFHLLKRQMHSQNPKNKAELKKKVLKAWNVIKPSIFQKIVHSMPQRLEAVIASKGYATKYWLTLILHIMIMCVPTLLWSDKSL